MIRLLMLCLAWYHAAVAVEGPWPLGYFMYHVPPVTRVVDGHDAREEGQAAAARRVRVEFARGRSDVAVAGEVRGYAVIDYVVAVDSTQRLIVRLVGANQYLLVAIYAPRGEAVCVEACDRQWTGRVPHSGDYTIRVGLARVEARRHGRASYTLHIGVTR